MPKDINDNNNNNNKQIRITISELIKFFKKMTIVILRYVC